MDCHTVLKGICDHCALHVHLPLQKSQYEHAPSEMTQNVPSHGRFH